MSGNQLKITATGIGNGKVNLALKDSKYELPPIVYYSDHSQNVMRVGSYDPISLSFKIKVVGGKVTINKIDRDTGEARPSGNAGATLEGAKFGIYYAEDDELLATVTTTADGTITSPILSKIGKMYIKDKNAGFICSKKSRKAFFSTI